MKKTYATPEVEVSAVSAQDILNASGEAENEALINAEVLFESLASLGL